MTVPGYFRGEFQPSVTYQPQEVVTDPLTGIAYQNTTTGPLRALDPASYPGSWTQVGTGYGGGGGGGVSAVQMDSGAAPTVDHVTALVDQNALLYDQASGKFKGKALLGVPNGAVASDLFYYNGSTLSRIPIGTTGQALVVSGGVPAWGAAAGGGGGASNTSWAPTAAIAENYSRVSRIQDAYTPTSGTLVLAGGAVLPANTAINSITFVQNSGGVGTPTHQFFCLVDRSLNVLAKTTDDTTTAWGGFSAKTLNLSAPYTPSVATPVYIGCVITATTTGSLIGISTTTAVDQPAPVLAGNSTSGLTTPASLGATAAAASIANVNPYCYVS